MLKKILLLIIYCSLGVYQVQAQVSAGFITGNTQGCPPLAVNFQNTSINATNYYWDFGNGNTSTLTNPVAVYTLPGSYTVKLVAINATNSDSIIQSNLITVHPKPQADFTWNLAGNCSNNNELTITNLTQGATSYYWDFGDGGTSTLSSPVHQYTLAGSNTVSLIATNSLGCSDLKINQNPVIIEPIPLINIGVSPQFSCDSNQVFQFSGNTTGANWWKWELGDGNTANLQNINHQYNTVGNFNVQLIAGAPNGCSDTLLVNNLVKIFNQSTPNVSINTNSGCAPLDVNFSASGSNISSFNWNFGDNTTGNGIYLNHVYTNQGIYSPYLTVTDSNGCQQTINFPNEITVSTEPDASFTLSDTMGCRPLTVDFLPATIGNYSYQWDFNDGETSTNSAPTHTYLINGFFKPSLTLTDSLGCTSTYQYDRIKTLTSKNLKAFADVQQGCGPLSVNFSAIGFNVVSWFWDFGDGTTSTLQNPNHVFDSIGFYTCLLYTSDAADEN